MTELNPGEKIKKLRMDLGLKQEDLTSEKISKSLISMIEKNKRGLTWPVAIIIAENLNRYYSRMGRVITPEYLMESGLDVIKREFKKEKDYLYSIIDSAKLEVKLIHRLFDKLMEIVNEWSLEAEMMELIALRGRFYYKYYQYNDALRDLSKALEYYIAERNSSEVARIYNLMGACYHMQMNIDSAINYFQKSYDTAIEYNTKNSVRVKIEAVFNLILCYRKTKKYDMVFHYINLYRELEGNDELYDFYFNQVALLEANTYREMGTYGRAEKAYEKLLHKREELDKNTLFLIYENFATLCQESGKVEKALKYIGMAMALMEELSDAQLASTLYLHKAKCHALLKEYDQAEAALEEGLKKAELVESKELILELHFALMEFYLMMKDYNNALRYMKDVENVVFSNGLNFTNRRAAFIAE